MPKHSRTWQTPSSHESEYHRLGYPELASADWKLLKRCSGLGVYQNRAVQAKQPMALRMGKLDGSLEDVLYGMHCKTREEFRVADIFQNRSLVDCAVLAKVERGSNKDPYRQLSVKWLSTRPEHCKMNAVQDLYVLEFIGSDVDSQGDRFGYLLVKNVDLGGYPEVRTTNVANTTMCCIFRQELNTQGGRASTFNTAATCSMLLFIATAIEIAEAKRLTQLAQQFAEYSVRASFTCAGRRRA